MSPYQQYNMDKELSDCLEIIYNLIFFLNDIKLALELDEEVPIIHPPFDPFKTIGKYCWLSSCPVINMSSTDSWSSASTVATLTPQGLSILIANPNMVQALHDAFPTGSTVNADLQDYSFISETIEILEKELEQHQQQWERIFNHLTDSWDFHYRMRPILATYEQRTSYLPYHPYTYTPSPHSSSSNSNNAPTSGNSKEIPCLPLYPLPVCHLPCVQPSSNSLSSYQSAIDETLGSKWNPIVISSDEEEHCRMQTKSWWKGLPMGVCLWSRKKSVGFNWSP